ncbi:MAG: type II secretion system protein [Candidatus Kerfeldbacteria bacterium]|nr:type II secretion system protein [Candidatus Kerfeldbacteria bacterium]
MSRKGFTFIELLIVIVLIGILAAIAIPNLIDMRNRAREVDVKEQMHTVQVAVEEFGVRHDGIFPTSLDDVRHLLPGERNPFTHALVGVCAGQDSSGLITYQPEICPVAQVPIGYAIKGRGARGQPLPLVLEPLVVKDE